jgi:hypothetical protein
MQTRFLLIWVLCWVPFCPLVLASAKSDKKAAVTLHMETESTDNPKMIFKHDLGGQPRFFRRMPDISGRDMAAFKPFTSMAGGDSGAIFKLTPNGARRLASVTSANQGRWLVAIVNGRMVDGVSLINKSTMGLLSSGRA